MKKRDIILVATILIIAVIMYIGINIAQSGKGSMVKITLDGKEYGTYSLSEEKTINIKSDTGTNTVYIHDGCVEMKEADCPDKYCVKQGKIKRVRQNIVCLPHKVVVEITSGSEKSDNKGDADVIAR